MCGPELGIYFLGVCWDTGYSNYLSGTWHWGMLTGLQKASALTPPRYRCYKFTQRISKVTAKSTQPTVAAGAPPWRSSARLRSSWVLDPHWASPEIEKWLYHSSVPHTQRMKEATLTMRATTGNPLQGASITRFKTLSTNLLWLP